LAEKYGWAKVQSIQNPYNLLNRLFEVGLSEVALQEKVGLLAYSPLGFGVLSGKYLANSDRQASDKSRLILYPDYQRYSSKNSITATQAYADLAQKNGLTPTQLALGFVNSRSFVTANIIGATTMEQLKENIASIDIDLSDEILQAINEIHARIPDPAP
jgi:aryl-alcohol dehydrogenase-like predicted oxidoreductase